MLRSIEKLEKFNVQASDGVLGHVRDFFFDDESWVVRYVVVNTGEWLSGRKVLISPISIGLVDARKKHLQVLLSRDQIEDSPDFDSDMPVSRRHELRYFKYYGYPCYWGGSGMWGDGSFPSLMCSDIDSRANGGTADAQQPQRSEHSPSIAPVTLHSVGGQTSFGSGDADALGKHDDPHLRSCKAVLQYEIQATDGLLGHVEGFLVDEETWAIRYLIARTSHWWLGHKVLISPDRITSVSWMEGTVGVDRSRAAIKALPMPESGDVIDPVPEGRAYKYEDRSDYRINQY